MLLAMAATGVPFDLAAVKLAAPFARPGTVAKGDVIARLSSATVPLATVVAPPGYGKTTLLARWAEADPRPFAWVALDRRDDDAVVFMRYIAAAIHQVEPLPPQVLDALSGPVASAWATRVTRLGNARGRTRASVRAGARRSACCRRSVLSGRARGAGPRTFRPARRSRSRPEKSRRCHLPAGAPRDRCKRSAWRISGWTSRRLRCSWKLPESSSTRVRSPS